MAFFFHGALKTAILSPMKRKLFIYVPAVILLLMIGVVAYTQDKKQPPQLKLNKIKEDLYEIEGDGGNVAVYLTNEGVILIDDKFDMDHEQIMSHVKSLTNQPIKYVISTHYHADHSGGNAKMYGENAEIISTTQSHKNIVEHKQSNAPPGVVPARVTFKDETTIYLGGKEVTARFVGRGHTNGDAVVYFPALKVLHTGDLMAGDTPLIDYPGGGSLKSWPVTLSEAMKDFDFDTVIPGHGPVTTKMGLMAYRDSVEKESKRVAQLMKQKKSEDEIGKVMMAEFHWMPGSLQMMWSLPGFKTEYK
jgi:glyoxylase-like metal-dependent hydrolase (beta-lactamase superfamily II)